MIKLNYISRLFIVGIFCFIIIEGNTQRLLTMDEAIAIALENNFTIRQNALELENEYNRKKYLSAIPKTDIDILIGQYNSIDRNDNNLTINQSIPFPSTFFKANAFGNAMIEGQELRKLSTENDVIYQVKETYLHLANLNARNKLLIQADSIFQKLLGASAVRFKTGETTLLEKTSIETQQLEVANKLHENEAKIKIHQSQLMALLNTKEKLDSKSPLSVLDFSFSLDSSSVNANPFLITLFKDVEIAGAQKKYEASKALPDINLGFFSQTLIGYQSINGQDQYFGPDKRFTGFQVGLSIPLFFGAYTARVKDAALKQSIAENSLAGYRHQYESYFDQAVQEFRKNNVSLEYYQRTAIPNADLIEKQTQLAFKNGEIDYTTLLMNTNGVISIRNNFLETMLQYNLSIIRIEYLIGNQPR